MISTQQAQESSVSASESETPDDDDVPLNPFPPKNAKTAAPTQKKMASVDTESEAEEPSSSAKTSKKKKKATDDIEPPPKVRRIHGGVQQIPRTPAGSKPSTGELTNYLLPLMLARVGIEKASSVLTNNAKKEMIEHILHQKPSMRFSVEDINYKLLNDTLLHHLKRAKQNIREAVAKLLLVQSNPTLDPHHAWALVIDRAQSRSPPVISPNAFTQEELGVPTGGYLVPRSSALWEKLGVSSDEPGIYLVPDGKSARTSVAADIEGNPYAKRFVEEGLGAYSPRTLTLTLTLTRSSATSLEIRSTLAHVPQLFRNVSY